MRVLLVEDDPVTRCVLEAQLRHLGHEPIACENGERALELLRSSAPPPIAFCDCRMPRLNGLELCARLQAEPALRPRIMILLTSDAGPAELRAALAAGADDLLPKPVDPAALELRLVMARRLAGQLERLDALEEAVAACDGCQSRLRGRPQS